MSAGQIKVVTLLALQYKKHKIPCLLFGFYLLSILVFSILYYTLYNIDPRNFTFHNEIREIRKQMNDEEFKNLVLKKNHDKEKLLKDIDLVKPIMVVAESSKTVRSSDSLKILFSEGYYMLTCRYPPGVIVLSVNDPPDPIFYLTVKSGKKITKINIPDLILPPPTVTVGIDGRYRVYGKKTPENSESTPHLVGGTMLGKKYAIPETVEDFKSLIAEYIEYLRTEIDVINVFLASEFNNSQNIWTGIDFIYFSTITQTTVGYGDILPNTAKVRFLVILQCIISVFLVGFAVYWIKKQ